MALLIEKALVFSLLMRRTILEKEKRGQVKTCPLFLFFQLVHNEYCVKLKNCLKFCFLSPHAIKCPSK